MSNKTVYLDRKLNKENLSECRRKILESIEQNENTVIYVKNGRYIEKEGLKTLVEVLEYSKKQSRELWLCELKPEILESMTFTNLNTWR